MLQRREQGVGGRKNKAPTTPRPYPESAAWWRFASNFDRIFVASSFQMSRSTTHESRSRRALRYSRVTCCLCESTGACFIAATTAPKPALRF
jgi:hypothetical protein